MQQHVYYSSLRVFVIPSNYDTYGLWLGLAARPFVSKFSIIATMDILELLTIYGFGGSRMVKCLVMHPAYLAPQAMFEN